MATYPACPPSNPDPVWLDQLGLSPAQRVEALVHFRRAERFAELFVQLVRGTQKLAAAAFPDRWRGAVKAPGLGAPDAPTAQQR